MTAGREKSDEVQEETKKLDVLSAAAEESERNMEKTTKSTDLMEAQSANNVLKAQDEFEASVGDDN